MRTLNRDEWRSLCESYEVVKGEWSTTARVSEGSVGIEFSGLASGAIHDADVHISEGATDVRVGQVQLLVSKNHAVLLTSHPPYPIERWTVLWEGELFPREER